MNSFMLLLTHVMLRAKSTSGKDCSTLLASVWLFTYSKCCCSIWMEHPFFACHIHYYFDSTFSRWCWVIPADKDHERYEMIVTKLALFLKKCEQEYDLIDDEEKFEKFKPQFKHIWQRLTQGKSLLYFPNTWLSLLGNLDSR